MKVAENSRSVTLYRQKTGEGAYRFGFNGQEMSNEVKGEGNSYTAEFWEYDSRLGRRWNVDPVVKEYESPYAVMGNNPIWNVDVDGADTSKYLNNQQLLAAIKIAYNVVKSHVDNKTFNIGKDYSEEVNKAMFSYLEQNQEISFGGVAEFKQQAFDYYKGFKEVAASVDGGIILGEFGEKVLNNKRVNTVATILITQKLINSKNGEMGSVAASGAQAFTIIMGAANPQLGPGPRGSQFSSGTQQALVESKAGFNFTNTTIKRFVDPARTVNAQDLRRAVSEPGVADAQGAAGATSHYTTILKNGNTYNLKVVYHAQSNTIYHFHYSRSAMGNLPKIKK